MNYDMWLQILFELALSISGEPELDNLIKETSSVFLKKLTCTYVSVLQYENDSLEVVHVVPKIASKHPKHCELISEFKKRKEKEQDKEVIMMKKDINYYGFPLKNFGLLIIGRNKPIEELYLRELLPIINLFAQNCFLNLDIARRRKAIEAEIEGERKKANKKIQMEKKRLEILFKNSTDAIAFIDNNYLIKDINNSFIKLFGYDINEIKGKDLDEILYINSKKAKKRYYTKKVLSGEEIVTEDVHYNKKGMSIDLIIKGHPVIIDGEITGAYVIYSDITKRKKHVEQLKYMSSHDQLTGLYNRRFLETEMRRLDTKRQLPISIIIGDLNGLKLTNDVFGHQKGDKLILNAADIIKKSCRNEDIIARWGGDEFVIFLPQTNAKTAKNIIKRIKDNCEKGKNKTIGISIALGYATKKDGEKSIWQIFKKAESHMYRDKLKNAKYYRNKVISYMKNTFFNEGIESEINAKQIREICEKIGEYINLDKHLLYELRLLATIHDIGKAANGENILMEVGASYKNKQIRIKKHPEIGYRIALTTPELSPIAEYILYHHEHWDGTGYPQGLKGEEIPLLSRIVAVAESFITLTSGGPNKMAVSQEIAINKIKEDAGTRFDPKVVEAFIKTFEK
ncbi:MAG TPA: diguanylate cyclase [Thermoanaerobacterales bacterium]|nr:diguanylate cyclase [Thermoanaerobacterales bacterium]